MVAMDKSNDLVGDNGRYILRSYTHFTVHFRNFQWLVGAQSFVSLGWETICDFKFKRTEKHNFTIATSMLNSFTPWYFIYSGCMWPFLRCGGENQNFMIIRWPISWFVYQCTHFTMSRHSNVDYAHDIIFLIGSKCFVGTTTTDGF